MTDGNAMYTLAAMIGSIMPDYAEGRPPEDEKRYWKWRRLHRRWSHWFVPYAILLLCTLPFASFTEIRGQSGSETFDALIRNDRGTIYAVFCSFAIGCLLHIAEDLLCGNVPSFNPGRQIGMRLFYLGSAKEYLFSLSVAAFLYLIAIM